MALFDDRAFSQIPGQTAMVCDHGYWLTDCAICEKRPGECDYGSCTQPATTTLDGRPMCARHGGRGGETWDAFVRRVGRDEAERFRATL